MGDVDVILIGACFEDELTDWPARIALYWWCAGVLDSEDGSLVNEHWTNHLDFGPEPVLGEIEDVPDYGWGQPFSRRDLDEESGLELIIGGLGDVAGR